MHDPHVKILRGPFPLQTLLIPFHFADPFSSLSTIVQFWLQLAL